MGPITADDIERLQPCEMMDRAADQVADAWAADALRRRQAVVLGLTDIGLPGMAAITAAIIRVVSPIGLVVLALWRSADGWRVMPLAPDSTLTIRPISPDQS